MHYKKPCNFASTSAMVLKFGPLIGKEVFFPIKINMKTNNKVTVMWSCDCKKIGSPEIYRLYPYFPLDIFDYESYGGWGGCFPLLPSFKLRIGNGCGDQFLQKFKRAEESLKIIPYFNFLDDIFKVVKTMQK